MKRGVVVNGVITAVIMVVLWFVFPPGDRLVMGGTILALIAFGMSFYLPRVRGFFIRHGRATMVVAVVAGVGGLAAIFGSTWMATDPEQAVSFSAAVMIFATMLAMAPWMARRVERDLPLLTAKPTPIPGGFQAVAEVREAVALPLRHAARVTNACGPFFLAYGGLALLMAIGIEWTSTAKLNLGDASFLMLGVLLVALVGQVLLWMASINWMRFVARPETFRMAWFPGRALWGWLWRWFIFGSVLRVLNGLEPWLKSHLPRAEAWQLSMLESAAWLTAGVVASPYLLVLVAVALDAPDRGLVASQRGFRAAGRKYLLGSALILGPYFAASWVLDQITSADAPLAVNAASLLAGAVLACALTVVGSTYATRVYLQGAPEP